MKYAFLIMGEFDSKKDRESMCNGNTQMIGVSSVEQACREAKRLQEEGVACIELCGAFGEEGARRVIEATKQELPVGYVVHLPEQDRLFEAVFGNH